MIIPAGMALADMPRQECLGRMTFDVPEDMQWAVYNAEYTDRITEGGGHGFTPKVYASGDAASYDYDGLTIFVSDIVERDTFDGAARYIKGTAQLYQEELKKNKVTFERILERFKRDNYKEEHISDIEKEINEIQRQDRKSVV